jgi:S1-C subfamily serine protease
MKRIFCSVALVVTLIVSLFAPRCLADDSAALVMKQGGHTVSLELKFSRRNANTLQRAISFLDYGPNGYATGFLVGDGLVMTAYHVVSGDLSVSKKSQLGFGLNDLLRVRAYVNGCEATIIKVDEDADLALLRICQSQKQTKAPAFQTSLSKDERLMLIARPHGDKMVRRGVFHGPYMSRGLQYWSAKIDARDGYSGSPVYNDRAELVGVFSGYDGSKKLAVISPGERAQKLLDDYLSSPKP